MGETGSRPEVGCIAQAVCSEVMYCWRGSDLSTDNVRPDTGGYSDEAKARGGDGDVDNGRVLGLECRRGKILRSRLDP